MALWQLTRALNGNKSVIGIEQFSPLHTLGSYTGESRLFRVAVKEGAEFVPMALKSRELWQDLNAAAGKPVFLSTGALSIAPKGFPKLADTLDNAKRHQIPVRTLSGKQLTSSYPQFKLPHGYEAVLDELGGAIRPELAIAAAQKLSEEQGAELFFNTPVLSIVPQDDRILIETEREVWSAAVAIVAPGSWCTKLFPILKNHIHIRPLALSWFTPSDIENFVPEMLPVFMLDYLDGNGTLNHFYGAPSLDGATVKCSTDFFDELATDSVDKVPLAVPSETQSRISATVKEFFPTMYEGISRFEIHHDGFTRTGQPIIQRSEESSIVIATGMSGTGMKFAPYYGKAAAELALSTSDHSSLAPFKHDISI